MSAPKIASTTEIYFSMCESLPSRLNIGCFRTPIFTMRSPLTCPLPLNLRVAPLSIPLGILSSSLVLTTSTPSPEQLLQGWPMVCPVPWQLWHSVRMIMIPWWKVINPVPWQGWHFCGLVPGFALVPLHVLHVHLRFNSIIYISIALPLRHRWPPRWNLCRISALCPHCTRQQCCRPRDDLASRLPCRPQRGPKKWTENRPYSPAALFVRWSRRSLLSCC